MRKWPRLNPGGCTHLRAVKKNKKASKVKKNLRVMVFRKLAENISIK